MISVVKNIFPACFPNLTKPRYHQIRIRSTVEVLKRHKLCKLERDQSCNTFLLTLRNSSGRENEPLLNRDVISKIRDFLAHAKSQATEGSVLITTGEGHSFCQGFDDYSGGGSDDLADLFRDVVSDLVSFPTPTIAAINGYAFGAGLILGLSHDHLAMKEGIMSLVFNDSAMKSVPPYFVPLIRSKVGSPLARRHLVLDHGKYRFEDAMTLGLLNMRVNGGIDAVDAAKKLAKELNNPRSNGKPYNELRQNMYPGLQELELGHP